MKKLLQRLKSNKGFTMQDLAIGIIILTLFAGTIGGSFIAVYKMQAQTKITSIATLYGIQILENIDKIDYDEVNDGDLRTWISDYKIPESMKLSLEVKKYNEEDTIKQVKLTINYEFADNSETLVLERFKVKEI